MLYEVITQIKSNTEYQALLKEIAHLEEQIKKVEDQELELMEKVEAHQPAVKEEQEHLKEIVAKADLEKTDLNVITSYSIHYTKLYDMIF